MFKKEQIENLLQDDSFVRFINGKAADSEKEYWNNWLEKHPDPEQLLKQINALIKLTAHKEKVIPDPQIELKKLQRKLDVMGSRPVKLHKNKAYALKKSKGYWGAVAAAVILIAVSAGMMIRFAGNEHYQLEEQDMPQIFSSSEHHTAYGEKAYLHLPDGSKIVLNANSYLTYKKIKRAEMEAPVVEVYLQGEALFDIEPSEEEASRKFFVQTSHGNVEVAGTVFWVETDHESTRTVLEKGEVRVSKSGLNISETAANLVLRPGEMAQFSREDDLIEVKQVNTEMYTSWTRNIWTFRSTSVQEIAQRIEKVFGIPVEILNAELSEKTLSGTISSENLQIIKEGLAEAIGEEVKEVNGTIMIGKR